MRSVDCPQGSVHSNALLGLLRREQPVVLLSETPGPEVVHFLLQTGELRGRSGEVQVAALIEVAVYAFLGDHAPHFPDGIEHRSVLGYGTLAIRVLGQFVKGLSLIHISEPTRLRRISYAVFCLKKKKKTNKKKKEESNQRQKITKNKKKNKQK